MLLSFFGCKVNNFTSSDTPIIFPLLILPASVLMTTIEVKGSCFDVAKCIDVLLVPPIVPLVVVKSLIDEEVVMLVVLFVEDIDFTLLTRPEIRKRQ